MLTTKQIKLFLSRYNLEGLLTKNVADLRNACVIFVD